jgi:hypothetical protein
MITTVLLWTCVAVFVATSAITLLGITGILKIEREYLNKLFYSLIIEIVAIAIFAFNQYIKNEKQPFVRITYPVSNFVLNGQSSIIVNGVAVLNKNKNQKISLVAIIEQDTLRFETIETSQRDGFTFPIQIKETYKNPINLYLQCSIVEGRKAILKDDEINITLTK